MEEEQDSDNLPSIVGTCPFMCPGKNACFKKKEFFFLLFCVWFPRNWRKTEGKRSGSRVSVLFFCLILKFLLIKLTFVGLC